MTTRHWVGSLKGARFGPLYWAEPETGEGVLSATVGDNQVFSFATLRDPAAPDKINLYADTPDEKGNRALLGSLTFDHATDIGCSGTWEWIDRTKGIFDLGIPARVGVPSDTPVQELSLKLWNKDIPLGAITLYRNDLARLIAELESFVPEGASTIIRATEGGQVIIQTAADYLARGDLPDVLKHISISREEAVTAGFKKIVTVNLDDSGGNNIVVSSPDELWTSAVSQRVAGFMRQFTSVFTGFLRKHGLDFNAILLAIVVVALPDYSLNERIVIFAALIIIALLIARYHKFIRLARVYLDPDRTKRPFSKEVPSAIFALIVAAVAWVFSALPQIFELLQRIAKSIF